MSKFISKHSFKQKSIRMAFLICCSLIISENAYSRYDVIGQWTRDYMQIAYSYSDNAIIMRFEFFDYNFGLCNENGYLESCDFYYSNSDGVFHKLMAAQTDDQEVDFWSWVIMKDKLPGIKLQLNECYYPANSTMWTDDTPTKRAEVYNYYNKAYLSIKWFLDSDYKDVKSIRIVGKWHVNGVWPKQNFDQTYYLPPKWDMISDKLNGSAHVSDIAVKISTEADAVVIKGAELNEIISVYTTSGALVKSIVTNDELVKFKLPKNQIYIIKIGEKGCNIVL